MKKNGDTHRNPNRASLKVWVTVCVPILIASAQLSMSAPTPPFQHVILISIDGLRPDAISRLSPDQVPAFYEMIKNGATTLNARTDYDYTITLPDHLCILTGLRVTGDKGHRYIHNYVGQRTIHEVHGSYVPSIFDVVHEHGLRSAFFAAKDKFALFIKSYGARGVYPKDSIFYQGKYVIDAYLITELDDPALLYVFLKELTKSAPHLVFLHLCGPDRVGHKKGWDVSAGSAYLKEVQRMDGFIGQILSTIREHWDLAGTTAVIVTSDHGGEGPSHMEADNLHNCTIPFLVWGKGIVGADLYALNSESRKDPGQARVPYDVPGQPIRNGDAANLALSLLGLPPIPGSTINGQQDLKVFK